ncbi:hypothetical protein GCM10027600_06600 [Nocardioides ginsengisegetis]
MLGTIYFFHYHMTGKSAGNFRFNTSDIKNKDINLPIISKHIIKRRNNLSNNELAYFLAGLIDGNG